MSMQVQPGAEGSLSESVHFPPTSGYLEHQHGGYHLDGRMAMAPPLSSASRAPPRAPVLMHEDGRGGGGGGAHYMHNAGYDRPEYEYGHAMRRVHGCGDHLGLHSGNLIEHLLLQENQKALRMASLVQSQASGCLSGCLSCGVGEKMLRFRDSEERILDEQGCYSRNVGEGPSRLVNLGAEADAGEYPDAWLRQPRPRQSNGAVGERSQSRISFSEDELGRSLCQGRRISYPVCHPTVSHSQASHHVQDHHHHSAGAAESSVPILGFSDADGRVRQRWSTQRHTYSENATEDDGWQRPSRSRVGPASAREQDRLSLPGIATGSLPRTSVGSPRRPASAFGDSVRLPQSTRTSSQSLAVMPENSAEPSYQDNTLQQNGIQRLVTQGPISLTNWYIMKVQIAEVGRILERKVAVGGWLGHNREHVKTSPIVNRLDIHKLVTEDGVEVFLEGTIDQETSTANGFAPGIVQCLSAGFPYMWKQLLRVRPVGESSSLAVSESLGCLHPKASKCLSEDESQGVIDPKTSKTIPGDVPCSSRDCEGTSPPSAGNEGLFAIQTPANIASDAVESEVAATAQAETPGVDGTEEAVTARAETTGVVGIEEAVTPRAEISGVVETVEGVITRAGASDVVETQAAVTARAETSCAAEMETTITARAETSDPMDECNAQDALLQQSCDVNPTSLNPVLTTEAPIEYATTDTPTKEVESGPIIDTTLVTIRRGRRSKKEKEPSQPVRSSRRLRQRQSRLSEFTVNQIDLLAPAGSEQVTSAMNTTGDKPAEEISLKIVPDVEQSPSEYEEVIMPDIIIEEVLKDLQQADADAVDQDPVGISADPQSMDVEVPDQTQDHCENLLNGSDDVESPKSNEEITIEAVLAKVEIVATVPTTPANLETEEIEETAPVAPFKSEREEMEEPAPATPPELLQSKAQPQADSLSKPRCQQASKERVFPEANARVTRSLKRRLKMSPVTETVVDVLSVTRSLKRLRRLSDAEAPRVEQSPNPHTSHQQEGTNEEPMANPHTPHQEEADAFNVRVQDQTTSPAKTVNCSNCKQPCSPHDLHVYNHNLLSSEVTPEQAVERVPKEEKVDYAPLSLDQHTAETQTTDLHNEDRTETFSMKRQSGRFKQMKPATRFAKTGLSRRLIVGDSGIGTSEAKGKKPVQRKGKRSIKRKGSTAGQGSREGKASKKIAESSEIEESSEDEGPSEIEESSAAKELCKIEGSSEGLALVSSRGKNRRTSMIPPPLPPPRVQDKSKVPEAFGLKTSRSGRLLVPPLAYWRSQSIEYDKDGGIIAIFDGFQANPADTGYFNFTPPQEKHARRIQEKLCKAATSVKKRK